MSTPYTHPSMPGTPREFPTHITASPGRTLPWQGTCTAKTADASNADWHAELEAQAIAFMTQPLESPDASSSSASSSL